MTGYDAPQATHYKPISVERAITLLVHFKIQMVEIDPDNPRALRFLMSNGQTLKMEPKGHRLFFTLATVR